MISRFPLPHALAASIAMSLAASAGLSQVAVAAAPQLHPDVAGRTAQDLQRYIVRFAEPALAAHNRTMRADKSKALSGVGLIPMRLKTNGRMHLDTHSAEAKVYLGQLAERQNAHQVEIASAIGRDVNFLRTYRHALNGAVIELTQQEAFAVGRLSGVASIVPDRSYALADDISTRYIGANAVWLGGPATDKYAGYTFPTLDSLFGELNSKYGFKGDGVVVGDIDTGYNSLSPSFAATDASGYTIKNPLGSGKYIGDCNVPGISLAGCNDKVIGVYDEINAQYYGKAPASVEDTQGHGSHTASTIVGNPRTAGFPGFNANISGIAPHANLIVYYACAPAPVNCPESATAGAVEQAIEDGVDVLNYSISGGDRPWNDPVSQAFLDAADAGIFIAAAAGNTGTGVPQPLPGTVNHLEPWVATVAATTLTGGVAPLLLSLTGPGTPPAATQSIPAVEGTYDTPLTAALPGTTKIVLSPTYDIGDLGSTSAPSHGTDGCSSYPADSFKNAIALISRGTCGFAVKVPNAIAAGAIAVIIADNRLEGGFSPTVGPPTVSVPVYSISQSAGNAFGTYLAANKNAGTASLGFSATRLAAQADSLANFSLIGPAIGVEAIKPDIAAPGVAVLAAVANDGSKNGPNLVAFYNGTSMATPHITGVGALLAGLHADWTPQEIKSAIMMTAQQSGVTKADGATAAGNFDVGSGRVRAFEASKAGLVLGERIDHFWDAYPELGGDPSTLNIASVQNSNCAVTCEFVRTLRSTSKGTTTWNVAVTGELANVVSVTPSTFTVGAGKTVDLTIDVDSRALNPNSGFHFANIALGAQLDSPVSAGQPDLHIPLAVSVPGPAFSAAGNVVNIALNGKSSGSAKLAVSNPGAGTVTFKPVSVANQPFAWIDQANEHYYGFFSTHYTDLGSADTDYYIADDFTIDGKDPVNLTSIVTPGFTINHTLASFGASLPLHWRIYADNKGLPSSDPDAGGAAAWSYDSTAGGAGVKVTGDTISLDLAAAKQSTALPAGKYWLVVYPDLLCKDTKNTGSCSEGWAWNNSWKGSGALWAAIAPQTKNNAWDNQSNNRAPYGLGLAMTLTSSAPCSATLPSWLSLVPANGVLGSASSGSVTFSANFTGASAGNGPPQTGYVCIGSSVQDALGFEIPRSVTPVQVNAK